MTDSRHRGRDGDSLREKTKRKLCQVSKAIGPFRRTSGTKSEAETARGFQGIGHGRF